MKKKLCFILFVFFIFCATSCSAASQAENILYSSEMTETEKESICVGKLSPEHEYYGEATAIDPECAEYITEISMYDEEIGDDFLIHLSFPPEYDSAQKYPMVLMPDGIWRLSAHPQLRQYMKDGEIKPAIVVSVGYSNGGDYIEKRERDFLHNPESYLHFIADNLVPYLTENYPIDSENLTLACNSYGGYWGFYSLFNSDTIGKNTFKNYCIGSPSLQASTGDDNIFTYEEKYHFRSAALPCNVYVTVGGLEPSGFIRPITDFVVSLNERLYNGLKVTYEILDDCGHNDVFNSSIKKALQIFYGD